MSLNEIKIFAIELKISILELEIPAVLIKSEKGLPYNRVTFQNGKRKTKN
jgi:hypothetical protein